MKKFLFGLLATSLAVTVQADPAAVATNAGGVKIFQAAERENPGNLCISPFSIQSALAMTYAGADGTTRSQMAAALEFSGDPAKLAASFETLNASLRQAAKGSGKNTTLHVANRLFGAKEFAFRKAFLETCRDRFGAPLEELNFRASPSAATDHINAWVEKQTATRIRNIIPPNALTKNTTLVLANALYLNIPWAEEFSTSPDLPFLVNGKEKLGVPAISRTDSFGYRKAGGFTAVGIPFRGGQFQFLILLPDKQATPLTAALLSASAHLPTRDVSLFLPKFRLEPPPLSLGEILQSLGMKSAFDIPRGSANFDGIARRRPDDYLCISKVFHKTFFALDEKGIEAAAATAIFISEVGCMSAQRKPVEVRVDRPFYFAVQHIPTGTCLFLGKVTDPR
jgi:serpin B